MKDFPVLATATFAAVAAVAPAQLSEGDHAPEFEFKQSTDTSITDFQALRGKVLMLDFFATT